MNFYVIKSVAFLVLAVSKIEPVSSVRVVSQMTVRLSNLSYYYFGLPLYRLNPPDIYLAGIFIPKSFLEGTYIPNIIFTHLRTPMVKFLMVRSTG